MFGLPDVILKNKYICQDHFLLTDYKTEKKKRLKSNAVPIKYTGEDDEDDVFNESSSSDESCIDVESVRSFPENKFPVHALDLLETIWIPEHAATE